MKVTSYLVRWWRHNLWDDDVRGDDILTVDNECILVPYKTAWKKLRFRAKDDLEFQVGLPWMDVHLWYWMGYVQEDLHIWKNYDFGLVLEIGSKIPVGGGGSTSIVSFLKWNLLSWCLVIVISARSKANISYYIKHLQINMLKRNGCD
jgi:hypothetical protein